MSLPSDPARAPSADGGSGTPPADPTVLLPEEIAATLPIDRPGRPADGCALGGVARDARQDRRARDHRFRPLRRSGPRPDHRFRPLRRSSPRPDRDAVHAGGPTTADLGLDLATRLAAIESGGQRPADELTMVAHEAAAWLHERIDQVFDEVHGHVATTLNGRRQPVLSFLDVHRWFVEDRGHEPEAAYADAMRIFRGSLPEAGPYPKGLAHNKDFVRVHTS